MKATLDLRLVFHRREDCIRAHILLCWLALLLIRVAENTTGHTWSKIRADVERLHIGVFTGPAGTFTSAPSCPSPRRPCSPKLKITEPPHILNAPATA
ncbi:hypothetical protein [Plantactinospora sp. BB1]|uniref:hypothetical protein n=1 Tax=Plantactinospora sp. BB1 TaxID=2071627 RepID=UPI0018FEAE0B|nr:hypothetical protein [Plantactinospora sp. BB1]